MEKLTIDIDKINQEEIKNEIKKLTEEKYKLNIQIDKHLNRLKKRKNDIIEKIIHLSNQLKRDENEELQFIIEF